MTRLVIALLTVLLLTRAAFAAPPACTGTDLLAELKAKDPAAYASVIAEAERLPNGQSLFWKIERPGTVPSFLLGTAHLTDPRVTGLPAAARDALANASAVALELAELRDQRLLMAATLRHAGLLVLPPGQSLWDLVPDPEEAAIRANPNLPPGAAATLYGYQPWVVAGMLSLPLCEVQRKGAGLDVLDSLIARTAAARHVPLIGLETVEEQLSVFAAMPLDLQTRYLVAVARLGPRTGDILETLVALYESGSVAAYLPLLARLDDGAADDRDLMAFVDETLIRKRNRNMAARAAGLLTGGNAFIAVGALHLPGGEGLVELIRQAGYKVTPVN